MGDPVRAVLGFLVIAVCLSLLLPSGGELGEGGTTNSSASVMPGNEALSGAT